MRQHLEDFFEEQKVLWPLLSTDEGVSLLPPISVSNVTVGVQQPGALSNMGVSNAAVAGNSIETAGEGSDAKYLQITWFTNLGFNNVRFILESALYVVDNNHHHRFT
jgi:hypothetical protein